MGADETNTVEEDIRPTMSHRPCPPTMSEPSYPLATSRQSAQAPNVRYILLPCTQQLKAYHKQEPVGWTYRQVLETVALPPIEAPHLWFSNISKLATQMGMPVGSTGRDIVMFVMHVASAKNELARVSELIRSITCTAKAVEHQALVASMLASTFPNKPLTGSLEGNVSPNVEIESSRAPKRGYDEVSPTIAPSSRTYNSWNIRSLPRPNLAITRSWNPRLLPPVLPAIPTIARKKYILALPDAPRSPSILKRICTAALRTVSGPSKILAPA